jgi:hypothetical protein
VTTNGKIDAHIAEAAKMPRLTPSQLCIHDKAMNDSTPATPNRCHARRAARPRCVTSSDRPMFDNDLSMATGSMLVHPPHRTVKQA